MLQSILALIIVSPEENSYAMAEDNELEKYVATLPCFGSNMCASNVWAPPVLFTPGQHSSFSVGYFWQTAAVFKLYNMCEPESVYYEALSE